MDAFRAESGDVDRHLADQLLLFGALAEGETRYTTSEITQHLRTNAEVIKHFVERDISISEKDKTVTIK
ncbi:MAG: RNA 3'-terminal phosphate cyclase [Candidatus Bilamarchaeaceae archaeon]